MISVYFGGLVFLFVRLASTECVRACFLWTVCMAIPIATTAGIRYGNQESKFWT